jgi:hypothetical protein
VNPQLSPADLEIWGDQVDLDLVLPSRCLECV